MNSKSICVNCVCCTIIFGSASTSPALADWNPGDPHGMKHAFPPDLSDRGMSVNASFDTAGHGGRFILFDDFLSDQPGPVTEIHLWGTWLNDVQPDGSPSNVTFLLSLHSNIHVGGGGLPDMTQYWLKTFTAEDFTVRQYATDLSIGWMEPDIGTYQSGASSVSWQYSFNIDLPEAFQQAYDTRYWLNVTAIPDDPDTRWGWMITDPAAPGRDNVAVWNREMSPWDDEHNPGANFIYLIYPPAHPGAGPLNMAFVMIPEPATLMLMALGGWSILRRPNGALTRNGGNHVR